MKIFLKCAALILALAPASSAMAQAIPATTCPVNYICSLAVSGTLPLAGLPTDGHPRSLLGYLVFDNAANISGSLELNNNGAVTNVTESGGTCTSGTATSPGVLSIATPRGTLSIDFVLSRLTTGAVMLLSNQTPVTPADTPVTLGACYPSAAG